MDNLKFLKEPNMHSFGMWEEAGEASENPREHKENIQIPARLEPGFETQNVKTVEAEFQAHISPGCPHHLL